MGFDALVTNMGGSDNTATGSGALSGNQIGNDNTATGHGALGHNANGSDNTAVGSFALESNQAGSNNTATGEAALLNNTASNNTAYGFQALLTNMTGTQNTAIGVAALQNNQNSNNTATGFQALSSNTGSGHSNTANGAFALQKNTTASNNTAIGYGALGKNTTGSGNIALGVQAGTNITGGNNIDIGNAGSAGEGNTIRIGTDVSPLTPSNGTFIAHISGFGVPNGVAVFVEPNGHLGTVQSSARFKDAIKPMDKASEAILALKPVTFHYKPELDPKSIPQFGLIAEEVEKVNPDLVARDADGKVNTVRYEAVNAMLLNEFLKEHRKIEELRATVGQQELAGAKQAKRIEEQQKQIEALTAGLQKVNQSIELNRPAAQVVKN